jgi:glycosyltransferase involved in cell wall biosynthesis
MNRLHHLRKTLPVNLSHAKGYANCDFVILDYNSTDGLEAWAAQHLNSLQVNVKYYKTEEPLVYNRSHSRNMVMRLAEGEILVNLDADNYIGEGFIDYILDAFSDGKNIFMAPNESAPSDVLGKMCFRKRDFELIGGYDEQLKLYGFEDIDLRNRLEMFGLIKQEFVLPEFCHAITHPEKERIENEAIYKNLKELFIRKLSPSETQFCFIFKDETFEMAKIQDTLFENKTEYLDLIEPKKRYCIIEHSVENGNCRQLKLENFQILSNSDEQVKAIHYYSQVKNKKIAEQKLYNKQIVANEMSGYGRGRVFRGITSFNITTIL